MLQHYYHNTFEHIRIGKLAFDASLSSKWFIDSAMAKRYTPSRKLNLHPYDHCKQSIIS